MTLGKTGHSWINGSQLDKWVTLGKTGHTWKRIILRKSHTCSKDLTCKMSHIWFKGSCLEKWVTLGKKITVGEIANTVTLGKKRVAWKNGSHFQKWVALEKGGKHLDKKGFTLAKMGHT